MSSESLQLEERGKLLGCFFPYASLLCSASLLLAWLRQEMAPGFRAFNRLTGFAFFKIARVGILLAVASTTGRSRLRKFAQPIAVVMFFVLM